MLENALSTFVKSLEGKSLNELEKQLEEAIEEYEKLSKETKPKLKKPILNKILKRPVVALPPDQHKLGRLNFVVLMISKLETEITYKRI